MLDRIEELTRRFEEVGELLVLPETMSNMKRYMTLGKEYKDLEKIVIVGKDYKNAVSNLANAKKALREEKDPEFRELAKMEVDELGDLIPELEEKIKQLLIPKDPNDDKNIILEIRAGAGGDESAIFAGELLKMYQRYSEKQGWSISMSDFSDGAAGGFSKVVVTITGNGVYGLMKYESGVHRVQRVPQTETQGRVHTSAASVAVLPEIDDVEVDIDMHDVRKDLFCASGPGGQSVNTTYSAVRLTHEPSGIVVQCQDQKSQLKNFDKALKELKSRIYAIELAKREAEVGAVRAGLIGSGDRSDKIRTYNWPQSRITDHRINKTVYNLDAVMGGEVGEFIEALRLAENADKMKEGSM